MTQQMSNEAAEEIIKLGIPVILGLAVTIGSALVSEVTTSLSDDYDAQLSLNREIHTLETEVEILQSAQELDKNTISTDEATQSRQEQISELQVRHDELGSEALNFSEAYSLPIVLGGAIAVLGIKRALKKSVIFGRQ